MTLPEPTEGIVDYINVPPSENIHSALSSNHDIYTGLDELIDNSIDAGADRIAIVFHTDNRRVVGITVHDNGVGISPEHINEMMRIGAHVPRSGETIGRYGVGFKEASLSNAYSATVVSTDENGATSGRVMMRNSFNVGILSDEAAEEVATVREELLDAPTGTSILWDKLLHVYTGEDHEKAAGFLSRLTAKTRVHLGIRYHRFLESKKLRIATFTHARGAAAPNLTLSPEPFNPFGYKRPGVPGYPRTLVPADDPNGPMLRVHIWPPSKSKDFELGQSDDFGHQGFFVYDRDRLITIGGWIRTRTNSRSQKLIRIELDDPRMIENYLTISAQKGSVLPKEPFHKYLDTLRDPDDPSVTLETCIADGIDAQKAANRRTNKRHPLVEPGKGFERDLRKVIREEVTFKNRPAMDIRWGHIDDDNFFDFDLPDSCLTLNNQYRILFSPDRGRLNDAPLVKALLYHLFNSAFDSERVGSRTADNLELWQATLTTAAQLELEALRARETEADAAEQEAAAEHDSAMRTNPTATEKPEHSAKRRRGRHHRDENTPPWDELLSRFSNRRHLEKGR
ncbi:ATP-binding protein [Corynebacterium hansenii]|uniref:ATP-binding protein n=1 Tax=Corynebacterium hansenii TaxID=394964 RepID=A0ABV7ZSF0_9CORY|nr:ATP-binding protein [Corynebacterium hansenii]WJY99833.1 DNA mismatch repair protein [Corynebacterium hansenii]